LKLIQACQSAGLVLGIISNAQFFTPYLFQWFFRQSTDQLGFHPELTIFSYQCGRAKPSPELFQKARLQLEKMGIAAGRVVFIGNDMRNDILPARNTGFQTVLFAGDARSLRLHEEDPVCSRAQADLVDTDLEHLLSYLSTP
jgi:putative hydrolase of the HAD superfamily